MCYFHGINIKIDEEKGEQWIIKAANQNHLLAIGLCHYFGWGEYEENDDKAFSYFMESYEKERDVWAMFYIGKCYFNGHGVKQDEKKGMEWFREATTFKCPFAMNNIGNCYINGIGVKENKNEAFKWYMKGAEENYSVSLYNVGLCYEKGRGIEEDLQKALEFYKSSANFGYEKSIKKVEELEK